MQDEVLSHTDKASLIQMEAGIYTALFVYASFQGTQITTFEKSICSTNEVSKRLAFQTAEQVLSQKLNLVDNGCGQTRRACKSYRVSIGTQIYLLYKNTQSDRG